MKSEYREPFLSAALASRKLDIRLLDGPSYFQPTMTAEVANSSTWKVFKDRIKPFAIVQTSADSVEFALSPKSPPWTYKDFTIFSGQDERNIATIEDLSIPEGEAFLRTNLRLAEAILSSEHAESHVAIGFNTRDYIAGQHHSIRNKLHSHVYVADSSVIRNSITPAQWKDLSWLDRLRFMEPTVFLAKDFLQSSIQRNLFSEHLEKREVVLNPGYISVYFKNSNSLPLVFGDLKKLFTESREEYEIIESILTDKVIDVETDRYLPREKQLRIHDIENYIIKNADWLSAESKNILRYLAQNLRVAEQRFAPGLAISSAGQAWATKGFAGAINFSLTHESDIIRMDIIPCVFSTSSMNKVLIAQGLPTVLKRGQGEASASQKLVMADFYGEVSGCLDGLLPEYIITR